MSNGKMLEELHNMLQKEDSIPDVVTNRMLFAAVLEIGERLSDLSTKYDVTVSDVLKRVAALEEYNRLHKVETNDNVTGKKVWDMFGKPIVNYAITLAVAYAFFKIFGFIP